jgi:hypothetical protein
MKRSNFTRALLCTLVATGVVACGGGSNTASSTASERTVVGKIVGFGSIIMDNGVEYETDGISSCDVDDQDIGGICQDSLFEGMHVVLKIDANGRVKSLKYDDELEGVASNIMGTAGNYSFEIYGVTITTTSADTLWDDFSANPPTALELDGANVEVSGEWRNGMLVASYVEKQNDSTHEVKGTVGMIVGTDFPLTLRNGSSIDVDASALSTLPMEGDFVELKGSYDGATSTFTATDFEIDDEDDFDDGSEADVTGTLSENTSSSTGYSIGNTEIDISSAPSCIAQIGSLVEAEGRIDAGVLVARKCEIED